MNCLLILIQYLLKVQQPLHLSFSWWINLVGVPLWGWKNAWRIIQLCLWWMWFSKFFFHSLMLLILFYRSLLAFFPVLHVFFLIILKYCSWIHCFEFCKSHLSVRILRLWSDPKSSRCCYQNDLIHFRNASSFSFCCKYCHSHLSRLHLQVERSPVYFSFKILTLKFPLS